MPERIQLHRTKGWRKPAGTVVVARPRIYGNPFRTGQPHPVDAWPMSAAETVELYRQWFPEHLDLDRLVRDLRDKDLACWCRPGAPCHGDVLLEFVNKEPADA